MIFDRRTVRQHTDRGDLAPYEMGDSLSGQLDVDGDQLVDLDRIVEAEPSRVPVNVLIRARSAHRYAVHAGEVPGPVFVGQRRVPFTLAQVLDDVIEVRA